MVLFCYTCMVLRILINMPCIKASTASASVQAFPWMVLKSTTTFLLIKSYFTCCPNHDVGSILNYARPTRRFYQASNPRSQVHNSNHWATRVDTNVLKHNSNLIYIFGSIFFYIPQKQNQSSIPSPFRKRLDNLYKNAMSSIIINMVGAIFIIICECVYIHPTLPVELCFLLLKYSSWKYIRQQEVYHACMHKSMCMYFIWSKRFAWCQY